VARMRAEGKEFGQRVREEQGLPQMPEPVREGNTEGLSNNYKIGGTEGYRIARLRQLGLITEAGHVYVWSQFFDRTQEEIHSRVRKRP
jgi:hypothetical protein